MSGTEARADADFNIPGAYIDGEGHVRNKKNLNHLGSLAHACALAYAVGEGAPFGDRAAELLYLWADTNKTVSGYDGALAMSYMGTSLLFAAELLIGSGKWDTKAAAPFLKWVREVFLPTADSIRERENNWGDWGLLAAVVSGAVLGDEQRLCDCAEKTREHIDHSIRPDGSMPRETARGSRGIWYTYFALAPMTASCNILRNSGTEDLFRYEGPAGQSIRKALDHLLYYCQHPGQWPYSEEPQDALNFVSVWPYNLFEALGNIYTEESYLRFAAAHRPLGITGHHDAWSFTTLLTRRP